MTNEKAGLLRAAAELAKKASKIGMGDAEIYHDLAIKYPEEYDSFISHYIAYRMIGKDLLKDAESFAKQIKGEDLKDADELQREQFKQLINLLQIEI